MSAARPGARYQRWWLGSKYSVSSVADAAGSEGRFADARDTLAKAEQQAEKAHRRAAREYVKVCLAGPEAVVTLGEDPDAPRRSFAMGSASIGLLDITIRVTLRRASARKRSFVCPSFYFPA